MTGLAPRPACSHCGRPLVVCFCDRITVLPTRTRILLLQHPRERRMGIGTARLAHLALPSSDLRVGVDFSTDPVVRSALAGPPPAYLLFPGPGALPVQSLPVGEPLTLVVLDGTWSQARKLASLNPALTALPRVAFNPRRPSAYQIRRQPADFCLSTIEALAEVLEVLEPDVGPWSRLLDPFRAMVERQRWFETEVRSRRHFRSPRTGDPRRQRLAERLSALGSRLVCAQGEANAWARRDPQRQDPETIHWVAHRPATGESFEAVLAPRRPLAPATPLHVELAAERLAAGGSVADWLQRWQRFSRADDVLVTWGGFYRGLAASDGLPLPVGTEAIDLRIELTRALRRRVGTVEESLAAIDSTAAALGFAGRGGRRLDALVGLVQGLVGRIHQSL